MDILWYDDIGIGDVMGKIVKGGKYSNSFNNR
jgi:serine phosphatase RsbU (regulator of sigma subunit)